MTRKGSEDKFNSLKIQWSLSRLTLKLRNDKHQLSRNTNKELAAELAKMIDNYEILILIMFKKQ